MSSSSTQAIGALEAQVNLLSSSSGRIVYNWRYLALLPQIRRLKWSNDDLRSKLFDADQRASRLAHNFGFKTIQEAEDSVRSPDFQTNVVKLNERLGLLEDELRKHLETSKEALQVNLKLREDLKRSQNEVFALKTELRGSGLKGNIVATAANDDPEKENWLVTITLVPRFLPDNLQSTYPAETRSGTRKQTSSDTHFIASRFNRPFAVVLFQLERHLNPRSAIDDGLSTDAAGRAPISLRPSFRGQSQGRCPPPRGLQEMERLQGLAIPIKYQWFTDAG